MTHHLHQLVGGFSPPLWKRYELTSIKGWLDSNSQLINEWEHIKFMFQTTNQWFSAQKKWDKVSSARERWDSTWFNIHQPEELWFLVGFSTMVGGTVVGKMKNSWQPNHHSQHQPWPWAELTIKHSSQAWKNQAPKKNPWVFLGGKS